jgi:uncharacterized membrane protein YidH (DUF202 family)
LIVALAQDEIDIESLSGSFVEYRRKDFAMEHFVSWIALSVALLSLGVNLIGQDVSRSLDPIQSYLFVEAKRKIARSTIYLALSLLPTVVLGFLVRIKFQNVGAFEPGKLENSLAAVSFIASVLSLRTFWHFIQLANSLRDRTT